MFNFIFDDTNYQKYGMQYRYADFIQYLSDNNLEYCIGEDINKHKYNIIDINYMYDNPTFLINDNCYIFCGSSRKVLKILDYYRLHNIKPDYTKYLLHNLYYANSLNAIFIPMFLYKNNINIKKVDNKYKYGIYANSYDVSYLLYKEIFDKLYVPIDNILFMDNQNGVPNNWHKTNDKDIFYSSIDIFLDFANDYTNRHVMSRTYLELIANNIPIHIVSFDKSKPISFKNFSHIEYEIIDKYDVFDLLNVKYEPKYFLTQTYSKYIKYLVNNLDKSIHYQFIEEYMDGRFIDSVGL